MSAGSRCWASLPADALAYIINECGLCQNDVAAIRLVCVHWRSTTNSHLKSLAPACTSLEQVAGIAGRFPFLTNCDLTRCDTRLVGHASLCRDASARLSTLLAALSRMPSLTSLHISDTFSERMGQKHWASLVCAQALVDVSQPSAAQAVSEVAAAPAARDAPASVGGSGSSVTPAAAAAASPTSTPTPTVATLPATAPSATAAVARAGPVAMTASASSSPLLDQDATVLVTAAATAAALATNSADPSRSSSTSGGDAPDVTATTVPELLQPPTCGPEHDRNPGDEGAAGDRQQTDTATVAGGADVAVEQAVTAAAYGAAAAAAPREPLLPSAEEEELTPGGASSPRQGELPSGVEVEASASKVLAPTLQLFAQAEEAAAAPSPPPPPPPPPPPLVLSAAELADPGIKSFARAISRPGATHQHAFWLPDWCGRLAGLQELHIRGRQRPSAGLPPCLLWLHAGRTAPQLTSLSLVRLSLVTLPEQLQHLTALTRLVAQDCSLSLMPRGLAAGLSRLQYMDLSLNGLTALPPDFTQLTALKHLDLQRNKLVALPPDIGRLSSVTCLLLNNNQLRQLPPSLATLRSVEVLSCSYNWLGGMGPSLPLLCSLPRLRRLELACVSDVRCRLVPPQDLRLLAANLTHLDLAANNLVPSDVLGTLTSVRSLVLSDCGLLAVPPWVRRLAPSLQHLDLSNNSLSELPSWLSACTRLRYLSIAHNRLSIRVPPSVLEQMPQLEVVESE